MKYVYVKKETIILVGNKSWKSLLQEKIQWDHKTLPIYVTEESERDDSSNYVLYKSTAKLWEKVLWIGYGVNKKKAEDDAAKNALEK
jgi:dsRNA-specific ribonuclease